MSVLGKAMVAGALLLRPTRLGTPHSSGQNSWLGSGAYRAQGPRLTRKVVHINVVHRDFPVVTAHSLHSDWMPAQRWFDRRIEKLMRGISIESDKETPIVRNCKKSKKFASRCRLRKTKQAKRNRTRLPRCTGFAKVGSHARFAI